MQRATPLDSSFRAYVSGGARGCTHEADDTKKMQEVKINFMKNETREKVERPQNYGFTSYFRKAEVKNGQIEKCAEHFTQFMGGNRSFPVCEAIDDRRYRILNAEEGEVAVYDDQQQSVKIKRKEIQTRSQKRITLRLIKDEDQHKDDAERDQQKHKDKPLSSMMLDKDTIEIIRTEDDGQLAAKKDEEDKPGTMLSRVFLDKDHVHIQTPHISILWDEENRKLTLSTEFTTIVMEDKDAKEITLTAPKKITLSTPNNDVVVNDENKVVQVGDKTAKIPIAHLGSITADGAWIIGNVAKKAVVI